MAKNIREATQQAVRGRGRLDTRPVYRAYQIVTTDDGERVAVADTGRLDMSIREFKQQSRMTQERLLRPRIPLRYAPLSGAPGLFLEFARLEPTQSAWSAFIHRYGTLGPDREQDRLSRFCEEVRRASRVLALYEAATATPAADVEAIEGMLGNMEEMLPGRDAIETPEDARTWALVEVELEVSRVLAAECYPALYQRELGGPYARTWAARSLLGYLYLQLYFLLTADGEPGRCEAPGCNALLDLPEPEELPEGDGSRRKRTYSNKRYCSDRCRNRAHYHNRKRRSR